MTYVASQLNVGVTRVQLAAASIACHNKPETASDRKSGVAFQNLQFEFWCLAFFPKNNAKSSAIVEPTSILAVAAFEWTRNANEFGFDGVACDANNRVAVATHVDKRKVWRQGGVGQGARLGDVAALRILETCPHSVPKQHVNGWLRAVIARSLSEVK
jgi:hypothetical protein